MPISKSTVVAAANIRQQMALREMTQEDLGARIGCSQSRIGAILKPKKDLRLETIDRIAAVLKLPSSVLITPSDSPADAVS